MMQKCWPDQRRLMRILSLWECALRTPAMQPHYPASPLLDNLRQSTACICWVWITCLGLVHWASNPSWPRWDEDGSEYWDSILAVHICSIILRANRSSCYFPNCDIVADFRSFQYIINNRYIYNSKTNWKETLWSQRTLFVNNAICNICAFLERRQWTTLKCNYPHFNLLS